MPAMAMLFCLPSRFPPSRLCPTLASDMGWLTSCGNQFQEAVLSVLLAQTPRLVNASRSCQACWPPRGQGPGSFSSLAPIREACWPRERQQAAVASGWLALTTPNYPGHTGARCSLRCTWLVFGPCRCSGEVPVSRPLQAEFSALLSSASRAVRTSEVLTACQTQMQGRHGPSAPPRSLHLLRHSRCPKPPRWPRPAVPITHALTP